MSVSADLNGQLDQVVFLNKNILVAAGTATIAGVDLKDFIGNLKVILTYSGAAADGSTTMTLNFLDSADNTTFTTITSPTFSAVTATSGQVSVSLDTRSVRRYVQIRHVVTGTTATFCTSVVGVGQKQVV